MKRKLTKKNMQEVQNAVNDLLKKSNSDFGTVNLNGICYFGWIKKIEIEEDDNGILCVNLFDTTDEYEPVAWINACQIQHVKNRRTITAKDIVFYIKDDINEVDIIVK